MTSAAVVVSRLPTIKTNFYRPFFIPSSAHDTALGGSLRAKRRQLGARIDGGLRAPGRRHISLHAAAPRQGLRDIRHRLPPARARAHTSAGGL